ncbi:calcineurin-like phosphoesterase family protein [Asticcacaulis biprosthecium C19]|uniref:Calcineurin-like phosphoesterase family protein n=1 Tax=Asticcacaulis biprosthecium C19 TaxID=715226 RepID=F4QMN6_9CAUL|nr:polynucleotide kinase-phosphatase [Asticcacaulis biprosthecium]EGF91477.1 calcineurin-like phosphoesterase family protein [Asticcacaulis biprosthecium C19]
MTQTLITLPDLSLVLLIGASGSGKSSFARKHFLPTEVISSDYCRGLVSDDENNQAATKDAFEVLNFIAGKRLAAGRLTVIDATNVQPESRKSLIDLARRHHVIPVAIVLNLPREVCHARNQSRTDRDFGKGVVWGQSDSLRRSLKGLRKEGFSHVTVLDSVEAIDAVRIERAPLWPDKKTQTGPFDIIGDVHGCFDELHALILKLGYVIEGREPYRVSHPEGRRLILAGDLVDRGPKTPEVLRIVMDMVESGVAYCVNGNHDEKLKKALSGRDVKIAHGLAESLEQLSHETPEFRRQVVDFLDGLISHYVFDGGRLAVSHAGLKEHYIGRGSPRIRSFAMFGETTGETDEFGLPVRYNWARDYRGSTMLVYGHTPVPEPEWLNRTINIDTGCVFGGKLTALRYPEKEIVQVDAAQVYCEPVRPIGHGRDARDGDMIDIEDVTGKRVVETALSRNIVIRDENAMAALEVMSRFAVDPRLLVYLPPTMSPPETSKLDGWLEHPIEAFDYYRQNGVTQVIAQEKHMGSRAVVVLGRDAGAVEQRFGISAGLGTVYTRTGRAFFNDRVLEQGFLARLGDAVTKAGLWEDLATDWLCLDAEILPWSAKAMALLEQQYAPVGAAATHVLPIAAELLARAGQPDLAAKMTARAQMAGAYRDAYRHYCWKVSGLDDYRIAPFHVLAHEGANNLDRDHLWHMAVIDRLCAVGRFVKATERKVIDLNDDAQMAEATAWWEAQTAAGMEGMVVKPLAFTVKGAKGLVQPGVKCRGREYLRIIYGPEYTAPEHLTRLKARNVGGKRALAQREYALGYEALTRFVAKEPLYRVHEAVFGVLALESEPVDPRL